MLTAIFIMPWVRLSARCRPNAPSTPGTLTHSLAADCSQPWEIAADVKKKWELHQVRITAAASLTLNLVTS